MSGKRIKISIGGRVFDVFNYAILAFVGLITVFPFYVTIVDSLAPPQDYLFKNIILWPSQIDLEYYKIIFYRGSAIYDAFKVTIFITIVGTLINMVLTTITAYALSKKTLPFRTGITLFMVFTMYFGGGMVPDYLLVRSLHLIDTVWAMMLPCALTTYYLLLMRNFIMQIPVEIQEAAVIDGISELGLVFRIIIPLSGAAIATISLFYAVIHWNTFYLGQLYINKRQLRPLQVYLNWALYDATLTDNPAKALKAYTEGTYQPPAEALKAANIMAATIPIVLVYPFLQRYFVKGVVMGSLKG